MRTTFMISLAALSLAALAAPAPVLAQSSSYTPGTVWQISSIKIEPGQFENYLDYLGGNWRKQLEYGKTRGYIVSYHVFAVNNAREGEPDLMLAVEYKDYVPVAQQLEYQKGYEAMMAMDTHKIDAASGKRVTMRREMGSIELQELKLK